MNGPEVRGRCSNQWAVRETEMEVLALNSGRAWPVRPDGNRQPGKGPHAGSSIKATIDPLQPCETDYDLPTRDLLEATAFIVKTGRRCLIWQSASIPPALRLPGTGWCRYS